MYESFCRSLYNYLKINDEENNREDYRIRIVEPIKLFVNPELYQELKQKGDPLYREASNLIYEFEQVGYGRFETFSRDLWAYDFDSVKDDTIPRERVIEQMGVMRLFLSTAYW